MTNAGTQAETFGAWVAQRLTDPVLLRVCLYGLFILSGGAGLIYESLWARYLGLFVGHTSYAQILVLAIFLGGMALGALAVSRHTQRLADPLKWYARIELAVGVIGLVFHEIYTAVTGLGYEVLLPAAGGGFPLQAVKWIVAGMLILPQSVLLGATFPLMSAGVLRRFDRQPGRTLSILYFANSFGAAVGVLLAGFWLLALAGLPGTLIVAGGINLVVALIALLVTRQYPITVAAVGTADASGTADTTRDASGALATVLVAVAFGTAVASFIYEIGWIRMLSLVLGSATHSFELMLSAFILGLALGAFWSRRHADRWKNPVRALGWVQWIMGAAALATIPLYTASFGWMVGLMHAFSRNAAGYTGFSLGRYGISLIIMLPATFCAGITLPLITRILVVRGVGERAIGRVYGFNTLGSIVGVVIAGLMLMPWVGLEAMVELGAALDMALGVWLFWVAAERRPLGKRFALVTALVAVVLVQLVVFTTRFDKTLLASSVYRSGRIPPPGSVEVLNYEDGRTATVSVQRNVQSGVTTIATNGKPDASLPDYWMMPCVDEGPRRTLGSDAATQALAPLITLAHTPSARIGAVIGQGSGMSSHFVLGSPEIEELVTVEIEPAMIRGARVFLPANRRVFEDPRSTIVIDDAKSHFAAARRRYDYIFSEPSNPWVSGVSSLFTTEFYGRISHYLAERGVFGQWLHLYEIDDALVLSVLAAIHANFRSYQIFMSDSRDVVIVASNMDELPKPDWSVFDLPEIRRDLCHVVPLSPRMLEATRLLGRRELAPLLHDWGQPNSDFFPVLDLGAERARFLGRAADGFTGLAASRFDPSAPFTGRRSAPTDETLAPVPTIAPIRDLAVTARLKGMPRPDSVENEELDAFIAEVSYLVSRFGALLDDGKPPADWGRWLADFETTEHALHGGIHGFADETFYGRVERFLDRTEAPEWARAAVAFRHGLARWDFSAVSVAGDALFPTVQQGKRYVPADEFLDGMVVAKLRMGDVPAAQRVFDAVSPLSRREPWDMRLRLLDAYITVALQAAEVGNGK